MSEPAFRPLFPDDSALADVGFAVVCRLNGCARFVRECSELIQQATLSPDDRRLVSHAARELAQSLTGLIDAVEGE